VPPSLANQRLHYMAAYKQTKATKLRVKCVVGKPQYGEVQGRNRVTITMYRFKLLDPDNMVAAVKGVVDGLKEAGWLVDDSEEFLDLVVKQGHVRRHDIKTTIQWEPVPTHS